MTRFSPAAQLRLHALAFLISLGLDQITKWWARARFSLPNGEPNYADFIPVLGEWLRLRLVYNHAAAFGMKPHSVLPFLHPMMFYVAFSIIAIIFLSIYYRKLGPREPLARLGIALILAGAVGNNLIDRLLMHKVTDFLDVGIPGVAARWPVFNIADSSVTVGIALLLIPPLFARRSAAPDSALSESSDAQPEIQDDPQSPRAEEDREKA